MGVLDNVVNALSSSRKPFINGLNSVGGFGSHFSYCPFVYRLSYGWQDHIGSWFGDESFDWDPQCFIADRSRF